MSSGKFHVLLFNTSESVNNAAELKRDGWTLLILEGRLFHDGRQQFEGSRTNQTKDKTERADILQIYNISILKADVEVNNGNSPNHFAFKWFDIDS